MANDYITLNPGSGGDSCDESAIAYSGSPTTRKRHRVVVGDDNIANALVKVSPFGSIISAEITKLAGGSFHGSALDSNIWTETVGVTGSSSLSGGIITLNPGLLVTGRVLETSAQVGRFAPSHPNFFLGRFAFGDTGDANNIRRIGCFTATDGFFFELNGTTPRLVTRKASSDTAITSFNGTSSAWTIDTDFHNYEVRVTAGTLSFFVDGNWVHTAAFTTTTWGATLHVPIAFESVNSGVVVGTPTLKSSVVSYSRFGEHTGRPLYKNIASATTTVLKTGVGTLHDILINKKGTAGATMTIYDNSAGSGTIIGTFDLTAVNIGGIDADLDFYTGLTIVTTGATIDVTITWE